MPNQELAAWALASSESPVRLLLVEDNPGDALLIREMLEEGEVKRFELDGAARLADAQERLRQSEVDLVLLDLGLPESQGLATFARIHREAPATPVVVISGLDDEETALAAVRAGAQDYLVKGRIEPSLLVRVIRHALGRHALEEQLRKAQRMEAIGNLVAGVAHDFNNLLTAILGNAEIHLQDRPEGDPVRAGLSEIKSAAERGAVLIRQLLAFSRQQVLEPRVLDVNTLILNLDGLLRRVVGETLELRTRFGPRLGSVRADPGQIEQVIFNLAVNARDAMASGGVLTLETENVELDGIYTQGHATVVLVVEDDDAVRTLSRRALETFGYRVLTAANAEEALELARAHPEPIPLVISDVVMPGIGGRELAERIARLRPASRMIFVSGYSEEAITNRGVLAPGVHFLQKPFTLDGLARKVRAVLDQG